MINKVNIEAFYDYFDEICMILYNNYSKPYLEGMNEAFNFLLDGSFEGNYEQHLEELEVVKKKIVKNEFQSEEVRKAVQLGLLKGYKHTYSSNSLITPDSIGIFISYLVKKLYKMNKLENILDPLVGSGNLLYTVINHLDKEVKAYGIDNDILKCNLSRNIGDLMDTDNEMFFQDTLTFFDEGFDLVVTDMPLVNDDEDYIPYKVINHHIDSLRDGGYFISIIDNDFFEKKGSDIFRKEVQNKGYIFGLIKLSETLFKTNPKSILIIRKKGDNISPVEDFLLVELPSFNEMKDFNNTVNQIDVWFSEREDLL